MQEPVRVAPEPQLGAGEVVSEADEVLEGPGWSEACPAQTSAPLGRNHPGLSGYAEGYWLVTVPVGRGWGGGMLRAVTQTGRPLGGPSDC